LCGVMTWIAEGLERTGPGLSTECRTCAGSEAVRAMRIGGHVAWRRQVIRLRTGEIVTIDP